MNAKDIKYSSRQTPCKVYYQHNHIGDITKSPTNKSKFVLRIDNVCWRNGEPAYTGPVTIHGRSMIGLKFMVNMAVEFMESSGTWKKLNQRDS